MAQADAADAAEDDPFGDRSGQELPEALARRESRLTKIREAREEAAREKAVAYAAKMEAEAVSTAPTRTKPFRTTRISGTSRTRIRRS